MPSLCQNKKAMTACEQSGNNVTDHFAQVSEMVNIGISAVREFDGYELSRYACYLIIMNGDSKRSNISRRNLLCSAH